MDFDKLVEKLVNALGMSEEDAVAAAAGAAAGFAIDALFFPAGIPPGTVTVLSGIAGYTGSRLLRNNPWYRRRTLARLDRLVKDGHLSQETCDHYKKKLIEKWLKTDDDVDADKQ